jgi:carboxyl-terminal processing protease
VDTLTKSGATRLLIDLRGTLRGDLDHGIAAARLFVKEGPLAVRLSRGGQKETVASNPGDGAITLPVALLVDQGTSYAAEVFAAALEEDDRADLVGINTLGRAARQRLVKLPDQSGLWLTYVRYLTPDAAPIHETGLEPEVEVELPEVDFGMEPPAGDPTLQKALDHIASKK